MTNIQDLPREGKTNIKVNDILFANLNSIGTWCKEQEAGLVVFTYKTNFPYTNFPYAPNDLIVVKYIGNGVFEEMVTGELLLYEGNRETAHNVLTADNSVTRVNPESQVVNRDNLRNLDITKNIAQKYPLILGDSLIDMNDASKKEYLRFSDEQRKGILSKLKEDAVKQTTEFITQIDETMKYIESKFALTEEQIDMAYLDNQIFDFKNRDHSK